LKSTLQTFIEKHQITEWHSKKEAIIKVISEEGVKKSNGKWKRSEGGEWMQATV
jgi:hypothetical protein